MSRAHRAAFACAPAALALMGLACASSIKTSYDADPDIDVTTFETFAWISGDPLIKPAEGIQEPSHVSPIDDKRIRRAVNHELAKRGYLEARSRDEADLVISYAIGTEDKLRVRESPGRSSVYYGGYGYGYWYGGSQVSVDQYKEGTLSLELWDRRTRQAVWVGWASKRLSRSGDDKGVIDQAVVKILEQLPARPGSEAARAAK